MALFVGGTPITPEQLATLKADLGIPEAEDITERYTSLLGTDDAIFVRSGVPGLVSADVMADAFGGDFTGQSITQSSRFNNTNTYYGGTVALAGSAVTYVGAGTTYTNYSSLTSHTGIAVPAGLAVGDMLTIALGEVSATVSSVVTNESQSLTQRVNQVGSIWSAVISGTVPTSVTVTLSSGEELRAQALAHRGVSQVGGTTNEDVIGVARDAIQYTTDAATGAVVVVYVSSSLSVTDAVFNGADAEDFAVKFDFQRVGVFTGLHDGPTGSNDIDLTWSGTDGGGRYITVAFKP